MIPQYKEFTVVANSFYNKGRSLCTVWLYGTHIITIIYTYYEVSLFPEVLQLLDKLIGCNELWLLEIGAIYYRHVFL